MIAETLRHRVYIANIKQAYLQKGPIIQDFYLGVVRKSACVAVCKTSSHIETL